MKGDHSTFEIDVLLQGIASTQLGLVSVEQATKVGIDKFALARRRRSGLLVPLFPGVMRLAASPATTTQGILAASLAVPGSTVAGLSAAIVHQMPLPARLQQPDALKVLSIAPGKRVNLRGIATVRQTSMQSRRWMTTRVTSPASTLLLLPRFVDGPTVERCLDHSLAHRLVSVDALCMMIESLPPSSVRHRQRLLELLDARSTGIGHRSGTEQRVGRWLNAEALSGWQANYRVPVGNGEEVEADFAWVDDRVALEVSPFFTHGSRATQERDAERRRLFVAHRWRVVEATDRDLENRRAFHRTVVALRRLLEDSEPQ
jgi:very-short-patch-repair endonuclease